MYPTLELLQAAFDVYITDVMDPLATIFFSDIVNSTALIVALHDDPDEMRAYLEMADRMDNQIGEAIEKARPIAMAAYN
jgi:hypothetical protein